MLTAVEPPRVDEFEEFEEEVWSEQHNDLENAKYWTDDWDNEDPDYIIQVRNILATHSQQ